MRMRKTLLLVFIHGFQGGDDTFGAFPKHLRALISHALPNIDVVALPYPRFETRGELKDCVARFREWLQNKVIDIEVSHFTPSPTVDPSVHTILIGHSMGGIVAVETLLLLASEQPIPAASSSNNPETPNFPSNTTLNSATGSSRPNPPDPKKGHEASTLMFPHIQGILAFDTPFLGLAPGMIAHNLEGGHKMASSALSAYNEVSTMFGWGSKSEPNVSTAATAGKSAGALPAPTADAAAAPKWQSWGKYAMFAGAAGAVAAGGAAALYSQREKITAGWAWASGHLLFIGDLARAEHLKKRVERAEQTCRERGLGCANMYTNLGKGAREGYGITSTVAGKERTFCNLPSKVQEKKQSKWKPGEMKWIPAINDKARDETSAHTSMFMPRDNPGFYTLGEKAKESVVSWIDQSWYKTSEGPGSKTRGQTFGEADEGWEKPGRDEVPEKEKEEWEGLDGADDEDVKMRDEDDDPDKDNNKLEGSVIVDKAADGKIPLPASPARSRRGWT